MEDEETSAILNLSQSESGGTGGVRCLECGAVYDKPAGVYSEDASLGCPDCGYLGWLAASVPFTPADAPIRFALGRLRLRPV